MRANLNVFVQVIAQREISCVVFNAWKCLGQILGLQGGWSQGGGVERARFRSKQF